jgi:hypothetical protein
MLIGRTKLHSDGMSEWAVQNGDVLCKHADHRKAISNRLVPDFYWQLNTMFFHQLAITGELCFRGRGDANAIRWLHARLAARQRGSTVDSVSCDTNRKAAKGVSDETCLEIATMAMAAGLASLYAVERFRAGDDSPHPLTPACERMKQLGMEMAKNGPLMTDKLVRHYVSTLMWFETVEGLEGLRFLADALEPAATQH